MCRQPDGTRRGFDTELARAISNSRNSHLSQHIMNQMLMERYSQRSPTWHSSCLFTEASGKQEDPGKKHLSEKTQNEEQVMKRLLMLAALVGGLTFAGSTKTAEAHGGFGGGF